MTDLPTVICSAATCQLGLGGSTAPLLRPDDIAVTRQRTRRLCGAQATLGFTRCLRWWGQDVGGSGPWCGEGCARVVGVGVKVPAWRRVTTGESRWPVVAAVAVAIALQVVLPTRFAPGHRLVPGLELALLIGLVVADPGRITGSSRLLRLASILLVAMISGTNAWSAVRLVQQIVQGEAQDPYTVLSSGAAIWATNVIVFALWYWEFDRGGPSARAGGHARFPDFSFPQMQNPELAPPHWEPRFADYLYMSFTNATALSPTDVMPLARWAKMTMLGQAAVSMVTVLLVIARAIGLLK